MKKTFALPATIVALASLLALATHASANGFATLYWLGSNGTLWSAGNNWSTDPVGTTSTDFSTNAYVNFSATGSSNSTATDLGGDLTISSFTIDTPDAVGISGGNLTIGGDISVGSSSSNNRLQISNGVAISAASMWAGAEVGANNNQVTVGANSTLTLTDDIYVGGNGSSNNLTITNGGAVSAFYMSAGRETSSNGNQINVGANSTLTLADILDVGFHGSSNNLTITNGGAVSANYTSVGREAGSNNNAILVTSNASMLINNDLIVGEGGSTNSMTVSEGGRVTSSVGYIGKDATSTDNAVTVTGTNSTWTNNGTLHVGYEGSNNILTVVNNGTVSASSISIATQDGSGGTLNIGTFGGNDTGGTINASSIVFGSGTGKINFNQSNAMAFSGNISGSGSVSQLGNSTTILTGANTYTGGTTITAGTLSVTGNVSGTEGVSIKSGTLAVQAGGLLLTGTGGNLSVGDASGDNGTLHISGGSLASATANIGNAFGSNGTANMSAGIWTTQSRLSVGFGGTGVLNLSGGFVSNDEGFVGNQDGSTGVVNMSNGTWTNDSFLDIGGSGTGTLNLSGGSITAANGSIAKYTGSTGIANITGGSWFNDNALSVGDMGNGTLNLSGGILSVGTNGTGTVDLAKTASSSGTLNWGNGTSMGSLLAGGITGGNGTAVVNLNFTGNSTIEAVFAGGLSLNQIGTGTSVLTANNTHTGGTTVSSGTLQLGNGGTSGAIAGNIVNDAVLAFNRSDDLAYNGIVSGTGTLEQRGTGTTTLVGNNTYTGGTTVNAGTLAGTTSSLQGAIANNSTVNFEQSTNGTYAGAMSGNGVLVKNGSGAVTLSGANSYTGGTTVNAGTLSVSGTVAAVSNNASFTVESGGVAGSVSNSAGAIATNNGTVASLANAGTFTNSGNITGSVTTNGTLASNGLIGGTLGVHGGSATIGNGGQVSGTSTVNSGSLVVSGTVAGVSNNASFTVESGGAAGSVSNLLGATGTNNGMVASLANAGTFTNSGNISGNATTSGTLSSTGRVGGTLGVNGGSATIGNGSQVAGTSTVNAGALTVSGTVAGVTNSATFTVQQGGAAGSVSNLLGANATNNGTVASLANAGNFTNSGNITGSVTTNGTLTSNGRVGGTLGVNSGSATIGAGGQVAGATTVNAGTLDVGGSVAGVTNYASLMIQQGGIAGDVTNLGIATNNGTTASLANLGTFTNSGNITGDLLSFDGAVRVSQSGRVLGNSTIGGGEFVVAGAVADVSNNALMRVETGGTAGAITNLGDAATTNNGTVASLLSSGAFTNSGNITGSVISFGTLESSGAIGGSLIVGGGVATINGTVAGATTVTVTETAAGILQGTGTLGELEILSGGTVAPGTVGTIGNLTAGNMIWNSGGIYNWQTSSLNGTGTPGSAWDLISSNGSLIINASANSTVGIRVTSLGGNLTNDIKKAEWEIGNFDGGIAGYSKSFFSVNATGLGARGRFFVTAEEHSLMLNYKTAAVWLGGNGNWTTASLWEDGYIAVDGDEVEFSGNGGTSINNKVNSVASLTFTSSASGSYILNGNALAVSGAGIINDSEFEHAIALNLSGGKVLGVNTARSNLTISGVISGNSSLTKNGSQTLTLTGNNTYEGGTTISSGTLALGGIAGAVTGDISVNSGATFAVNRTNDATISNRITGAGSFAQVGTSTTNMMAANTYSGGTTISSGTLWTKNSQALGIGNVLLNGGTLLTTSSQESIMGNQTLSIGGNLDWTSGKIAFYDTGTSPLSGNLTINVAGDFTASLGNKTFDFSGVEALNAGNYTLVSTVGLVNAVGVNFVAAHGQYTQLFGSFTTTNNTVVYTVTGATSGGANIENNGGPNTPIIANYNITVPTITVGVNNRVNALTFTGSNSLAIQSNGELTVTSGTLAVQSGSSVVSGGTLNTPGNFDKTGAGELDLDNTTNVNGIANVVEGLLSVNGELNANSVLVDPTATLGGAGLIVASNVVVNGNLSPGNSPGTLSVAGNLVLTGANATIIEIASPTNFDRIVVSGTATLGGTLNAVAYGGGTITPGARYDFLQAGSIDGEFDSLIAPDGLRIRFLNSGTVGTLLFGPASFVPYALNQNQINVAKALDIFVLATEGDAIVVGTALDSLTAEQFPAAFDQIMPGFYESLANIAIEQAFAQTQMLNQRISSVRLGAAGFQAIGGISQPLVHDKNGKSAAEAKNASPIVESATATNWNSWALGTGMFSRSTNLGSLQNYNNDAGGFLVGADYRWSENFVTGLYGGYDYSYAEYNGGGSTKGNSFNFGTYASYAKDGYYADAVIGGGYTGFQTKRSIEFSTIDRTASADPGSGQFTAGLNLGKDFEVGKFTLGPIVGAQYTYAGIGSFTESGAESLDLSLGQQNANSLRSTLGGRIAYTWNLNQKIALIPEVRMFWQHEFLNNPRNINASLDGGNGAAFDFETTDPYRDSVFAGTGVTAQFGERWNASLFYNINFGSQTYQSNMVSAGLNFSF